ncbi:S-fimbrial protein subunit SfaA precursor [compost metagenome]|uniref:Major type 1 subunit fimbrin (Pilin) n=1 Tax=Pseudomonas jinjuensis TaxID=198616 RepID=A0A1H0G3N3_9PSED|nr:fimbrial protein [Pseudomonas jinjuensis]SDO01349.1 major type 1 subunit fimbrin (pilin) [Pseudomonas jinjuensis]
MKKLHAAVALVALGLGSNAFAYDALVNFNGEVTDQTCKIDGSDSAVTKTVNLPTVSVNALANVGDWAGRTPFNFQLTDCSSARATAHFEPGPTIDTGNGNLNNQASGGSNAQIQLLNDGFTPINLATNTGSQTVDTSSGSATLQYYAQYYAKVAPATAGLVTSSVYMTLDYQ